VQRNCCSTAEYSPSRHVESGATIKNCGDETPGLDVFVRILQSLMEREARKPMAQPVVSTSAPPRCLDGGDVDLLHRHHRLEGTLCFTAPAASASVSTRGVICQERPQRSLHHPP
jgi:hypothetical protein